MGIGYSGAYTAPRVDLGEAFDEYAFNLDWMIGMKLFAPLEVPRKEATFPKITRENRLRNENLRRGAAGDYNRTSFEAEDQTYRCEEYGLESRVGDDERSLYANDFDAEFEATRLVFERLILGHEIRVRDILMGAGFTVAIGNRTDVAVAWAQPQADIIQDYLTAIEAVRIRTGMRPNVAWISAVSVPDLIVNQGIRDSIQHVGIPTASMVLGQLPGLLGVEQMVVAGSVVNAAIEGQAAALGDIWRDPGIVVGGELNQRRAGVAVVAPQNATIKTPCVGRTFMWAQDSPSQVVVEEYRDEPKRSTIYRARHNVDELLIDASFAQLLDIAG